MHKIILPCPNLGDNNGGTLSYFKNLKFEFLAMGYTIDLIDFKSPSAFTDLAKSLSGGNAVVYSNFFTDMRVSATNHFRDTSLFDLFGARSFMLCADMPYKMFMLERIFHSGNATMVLLDRTYEAMIRLLNPAVKRFSVMETYVSQQALVPLPWEDREIDLLIPMNFTRQRKSLADVVGWCGAEHRDLIMAYHEAIRGNLTEDPLLVFDQVLTAACGYGVRERCGEQNQFIMLVCKILSAVDDIVRQDRREDMTRAILADCRPFTRIVALGDTNLLGEAGEKVEWIGYQNAMTMHALMTRSRMVLNTHPVIPHGTHERVADTLMSGAVLVTDVNTRLRETLTAGVDYLPHSPGQSLAGTVADLDLAGVAAAGLAFAQEHFTMARHAAYLARVFQGAPDLAPHGVEPR